MHYSPTAFIRHYLHITMTQELKVAWSDKDIHSKDNEVIYFSCQRYPTY